MIGLKDHGCICVKRGESKSRKMDDVKNGLNRRVTQLLVFHHTDTHIQVLYLALASSIHNTTETTLISYTVDIRK
jgi:hypothetical protein